MGNNQRGLVSGAGWGGGEHAWITSMDRFWILKRMEIIRRKKEKMLRNKGKVVGNFTRRPNPSQVTRMTQNIN